MLFYSPLSVWLLSAAAVSDECSSDAVGDFARRRLRVQVSVVAADRHGVRCFRRRPSEGDERSSNDCAEQRFETLSIRARVRNPETDLRATLEFLYYLSPELRALFEFLDVVKISLDSCCVCMSRTLYQLSILHGFRIPWHPYCSRSRRWVVIEFLVAAWLRLR